MMIVPHGTPQKPGFTAERRVRRTAPQSLFRGCGTYSDRKIQWETQHPEATPEQHQAAMRRISRESGI